MSEKNFEDEIANLLDEEGFNITRQARVGQSSTDIFIDTPVSGSVIIDVKTWEPTDENIDIAKRYAEAYKSASGADYSFVVLPNLGDKGNVPGILTSGSIIRELKQLPPKKTQVNKLSVSNNISKEQVFVSMPFSENYVDTFVRAIEPACLEIDAKCLQLKYDEYTGDGVKKIHDEIYNSYFLIADISESRPSVLYEVGYAIGIGKKVIQICSTDENNIPFVVRNNNTKFYQLGNTTPLYEELTSSVVSLNRQLKN